MSQVTATEIHPITGKALVSHDPDARITATPWPASLAVTVDAVGGAWTASLEGHFDCECRRCLGHVSVRGGNPRFCPWCGESFGEHGAPDARFVADHEDADE